MAAAATIVSNLNESERVAIAAWVSVAIVGTASVISAGAAARRRTLEVHRDGRQARDESKPRNG